jgi:preprotein translocase subunit YajC
MEGVARFSLTAPLWEGMFENVLAAAPLAATDPNGFINFVPIILVFFIFYFVLIRPMQQKQRRLEELSKKLQAGDKIILNPGIFATVVSVEQDALYVRIDEKTRIKVLRSAVAGLQSEKPPAEK